MINSFQDRWLQLNVNIAENTDL